LSGGPTLGPREAKAQLRRRLLAARAALPPAVRTAAARALAQHLLTSRALQSARTICAYVPLPAEPMPPLAALMPGSRPGVALSGVPGLPPALPPALPPGRQVLLPVLLDDGDLDWAAYDGPSSLAPSRYGLRSPTTPRLGRAAVASADVVLVPALAADVSGVRLGRGGGAYDRALARVRPDVPVVALLHDGELLEELPREPHDRPVSAVVTPSQGWRTVG